MSLTGTLSEFGPIEIIDVIGTLGKSGTLSLNRGADRGLVVFRHGKIVYAASSGLRENLGSMLLARGLITEIELVDALGTQAQANKERRLGSILIEMGALSQEDLEKVILAQAVKAVSAFTHWSTGDFEFSTVSIENHGEIELETEELKTSLGLSPATLMSGINPHADEADQVGSDVSFEPQTPSSPEPGTDDSTPPGEPDFQEPGETSSLNDFVGEVCGPQAKGELIQRLLEQAAETFGRSVVFSAGHSGFHPIAQTGRSLPQSSGGPPLLDIVLERHVPSLLSRCMTVGQTVTDELPGEEGDRMLISALGGPAEGEAVAIPMLVRGETVLILYGDDILEERRTGWLENLESFLEKAGRAVEADIQAEIAAQTSPE
ncbi:MAG: DUF4388 domain-containing protein [Thermoanaerobaculia bacterium]|jgi:hypothetical protein